MKSWVKTNQRLMEKKKQRSDEGDDNKKKIEIHIVCCTIM